MRLTSEYDEYYSSSSGESSLVRVAWMRVYSSRMMELQLGFVLGSTGDKNWQIVVFGIKMIILRTSCCAGWRLDFCDRENCPLLKEPQSIHFSGKYHAILQYIQIESVNFIGWGQSCPVRDCWSCQDESWLLVSRMPELMLWLNFKILLKSAGDKVCLFKKLLFWRTR